MTKINKKNFKIALEGTYGVKSAIAQKLGVTRAAMTVFLQKNPELDAIRELESEKIIDIAENRLFKAVNDGEKWAIDKILSTKGKLRGYAPKEEIEHTVKDFEIKINIPKEVEALLDE